MEYYEKWKLYKYQDKLNKLLEKNNDKVQKILSDMYELNNISKHFGGINIDADNNWILTAYEYSIGKYIELDEKLENVNFSQQCPLFFIKLIDNECSYALVRYPHTISLKDSIDTFYIENTPYIPNINILTSTNIDTKNKIIESICIGEIRDKLIKLSMSAEQIKEGGIIFITFPSKFIEEKKILLDFIPKDMTLTLEEQKEFPKLSDKYNDYNNKLDLFVMFTISITSDNSYYLSYLIKNYKFLKDIKFRKLFFNYLYFDEKKDNNLFNSIIDSDIGSIFKKINHRKYGYSYPHPMKLQQYQHFWNERYNLNPNIIKKIKNKIYSYKSSDKKKYSIDNELSYDDIIKLLMCYNYKCDECGLEVILDYEKDCYLQFSIDRLDDSKCHTYDNIRLTCLSCNVNHQKNTQVSFSTIYTK